MASEGVSYIFLDEGGDLTFDRKKGSEYFTLTGVLTKRPFALDSVLTDLRFDLIEEGTELEEFHATNDRQATRNRVFASIRDNLGPLRVDSVVVQKRKTHPSVQHIERFYPEMLGYLLRYTIREESLASASEVIVVTDKLPLKQKRRAIEKAVKTTLKRMLPSNVKHRVMHHDSRSCCGLQVADYLNWAIFRKWESGDERSYKLIESALMSEFSIFRYGHTYYY
jgi:hypothetical protein